MVTLPSDTMPVGRRHARKITARKGISTGWMARMAPPATSTPLPPLKPKYSGFRCPMTAKMAARYTPR